MSITKPLYLAIRNHVLKLTGNEYLFHREYLNATMASNQARNLNEKEKAKLKT